MLVSAGEADLRGEEAVRALGAMKTIVTSELAPGEMMASDDAAAVQRVTETLLKMGKLDIADLEKAFRDEQA